MIRVVIVIFLTLFSIALLAQDEEFLDFEEYLNSQTCIIKLDGEKITCKNIKALGSKVKCEVNGKKTYFSSKSIQGYINDGKEFHAGKYSDMGSLGAFRWTFMKPITVGPLHLYKIGVYVKSTLNSGNPAISSGSTSYIYYVRKEDSSDKKFIRLGTSWRSNLKKYCSDCKAFVEKIEDTKYMANEGDFLTIVNFYNEKCTSGK